MMTIVAAIGRYLESEWPMILVFAELSIGAILLARWQWRNRRPEPVKLPEPPEHVMAELPMREEEIIILPKDRTAMHTYDSPESEPSNGRTARRTAPFYPGRGRAR